MIIPAIVGSLLTVIAGVLFVHFAFLYQQDKNAPIRTSMITRYRCAVASVFHGCGLNHFGTSPAMGGARPDDFQLVYEFDTPPIACLRNPEKMRGMAPTIRNLVSEGMTELLFVEVQTSKPLIRFSTISGWTNHTTVPIEFPDLRNYFPNRIIPWH